MNKFFLDIKTLKNNIIVLKKRYKKQKFCAMVKANAYGHGLKYISKNIQNLVDCFGVAYVCEGIKLRNYNIHKQILLVGAYDKKQITRAIINDLTITISSLGEAKDLIKKADKLKIKTLVHIKINTGMNRYGLNDLCEFKKILWLIKNQKYVVLDGVFTHISKASDKHSTLKQFRAFKKFCCLCKGITMHVCASEAAEKFKGLRLNMVRIGLAMYGYGKGTKPILSIKSNLCDIKSVKKGGCVGYENSAVLQKNSKIGVVSMGYADGINFRLGNKGYVTINGKNAKIIGRICMDCFMVDITGLDVKNGDDVEVFSPENNAEVWAKQCGTIAYDILTGFNFSRLKVVLRK